MCKCDMNNIKIWTDAFSHAYCLHFLQTTYLHLHHQLHLLQHIYNPHHLFYASSIFYYYLQSVKQIWDYKATQEHNTIMMIMTHLALSLSHTHTHTNTDSNNYEKKYSKRIMEGTKLI